MRVYIPVTLAILQQLVADGVVQPLGGTAFAVSAMATPPWTLTAGPPSRLA